MLPQVVVLAQVLALVLMFIGGVIGLSFVAKKLFFPAAARRTSAPDDARLRRLEEGMDAIAVEIERVAEAQRFTTRLLAARATEHEGAAGR
jgi:hypothetical protein